MKLYAIGEIIWDIYDTEKVIGGATFNFCGHCARLGDETYLISAVGTDELGRNALNIADQLGMQTCHIASLDAPTGACIVTLDENAKPNFNVLQNVAYDQIPIMNSPLSGDCLYFGTLIQRAPQSRRALRAITEQGAFREIFCDINLRNGCYDEDSLSYTLRHATLVKLSDDEAPALYAMGMLPRGNAPVWEALAQAYPNLKVIVYTMGAEGSLAYDAASGQIFRSETPRPEKVVSTVGAGDSYCSAFIHHYMQGDSLEICVREATRLSSHVVAHREAIPPM